MGDPVRAWLGKETRVLGRSPATLRLIACAAAIFLGLSVSLTARANTKTNTDNHIPGFSQTQSIYYNVQSCSDRQGTRTHYQIWEVANSWTRSSIYDLVQTEYNFSQLGFACGGSTPSRSQFNSGVFDANFGSAYSTYENVYVSWPYVASSQSPDEDYANLGSYVYHAGTYKGHLCTAEVIYGGAPPCY